jgi:hypothetical protein
MCISGQELSNFEMSYVVASASCAEQSRYSEAG